MDIENQNNLEDRPAKNGKPEPTQIEFLRSLADIAREENLAELEVEQAGVRITLRSIDADPFVLPANTNPVQYVTPLGIAQAETAPQASTQSTPPVAAREENLIEIVSPMVGVFYRAPSPADPNFIEIGDKVEIGQTVALVEAMKVFNEIVAEVSGVVAEIKAAGSDLVETGQTIITLRP